MRKTQVVAAAAALLFGGGAVIAVVSDRAGDDVGSAHVARAQANVAADDLFAGNVASGGATADASRAAPAPAEQQSRVPDAPSRVVKTASLELSVRSNDLVTKASQEANRVAAAHGGFVATTEASKREGRQTTITLRVPADRFDAALTELRRLGEVESENLGGKDVTSALVDLDARLRSLRAQAEALNALMAKARTVGETLEVAREAANVRMQIEQLAAQQAQLADQADYATITLHVVGPNVAIHESPAAEPLLVNSVERAVGGALAVFGGAIVLLGYVLPAALLAALGYGVWRLIRSRRLHDAAVAS